MEGETGKVEQVVAEKMPDIRRVSRTRRTDEALAFPMFMLSLVVLALFATMLHLYSPESNDYGILLVCLIGLGLTWPAFVVELVVHWIIGSPRLRQHLWFCLFPVLRIGARDHETGTQIWLPLSGWRIINRPFEKSLLRSFSVPMIIVALLVLPVISLEFFWKDWVDSNPSWQVALQITAALIWCAFTFEFTLLMSVVQKPWTYARRHWIDLAIILLPMVTFLRAARLAQLARVKQIARAARVYRLRGLAMRMWRALVTLEVIEMILSRNPERRLEKLELQLDEKMEEVGYLKRDIERLRKRIAAKEAEEAADGDASGETADSTAM